ncbi:MAG TPA: hypothetical protein VK944_07725 [Candidatus Limnocylindria bacterium]|nr:hypothetical protein [Candidatus Limnocylindria bacterium]
MRRLLYLGVASILVLALSGCGGGGRDTRTVFFAEVLSDVSVDGDLSLAPGEVVPLLTPATAFNEILVGVDGMGVEYRGFIHFPFDGSTAGDSIPSDADVRFAYLEFFVSSVNFIGTADFLMDLVSFPPPLVPDDYFRDVTIPLASRIFPMRSDDLDGFVRIEITPLVREAIRLGLPDFQVRVLLDLDFTFGQFGVEDLPGRTGTVTAPLLYVEYY